MGEVVVSFTDETAQIENVSEIRMTVDKVELYSETKGWVEIDSSDVEYELLALKASGESHVYATAEVAADAYSRAKVTLKQAIVEEVDGSMEAATLVATEIEMPASTRVEEGSTASVHLDVLADQSLHVTTEGEYVFAPVIAVETRSGADVTVASNGVVSLSGGVVDTNTTFGTDIDGSVKANFRLDANTKIELDSDVLQIMGAPDASTNVDANIDTTIDVDGALDGSVNRAIDGQVEGGVDGAVDGLLDY